MTRSDSERPHVALSPKLACFASLISRYNWRIHLGISEGDLIKILQINTDDQMHWLESQVYGRQWLAKHKI